MARRSSSPSHDLIRKLRDNQSPRRKVSTQSERDRSSSRPRRAERAGSVDHLNYSSASNGDRRQTRNRSVSNLTRGDRTRSHSRSSAHTPINQTARSRSYSRPGTPTPLVAKDQNETQSTVNCVHASPRRDKRHAHDTPSRIPAPIMIKSHESGAMISSTSTCNSMDSLKTV